MAAVETAVILAAGRGTRLGSIGTEQPKGFLRLGERPIIEESLTRLRTVGINRVVIVTGHLHNYYDQLAAASAGFVTTAYNPVYATSGSMYSLTCAAPHISDDFLLLESDIIYAPHALEVLQTTTLPNAVLLSGPTAAGDEVWVETNEEGLLRRMSKQRGELATVRGELVGISRINVALFVQMCAWAEERFARDLMVDYETDGLVAMATREAIYTLYINDLLWAEIDDMAHLERARNHIYPQLPL